MKVSDVFEKFLQYQKAVNRPRTVLNYKDNIKPFLSFCGASMEILAITQDFLLSYQVEVNSRSVSPATKSTRIRHLKCFLRWCIDNGFLSSASVDVRKIKEPRHYKKPISPLSVEQVVSLFDSIKAETPWLTVRNKLIVALMYDSGLRQSEVTGLLRNNVFENTLIVSGKGGKERTVPLGAVTRHFLANYRRLCPFDSEYLLISRRGEKMTNNAVKLLFQKLKKKVDFPVHSHLLRHNFATNYLVDQLEKDGKADVFSLQALMGHEDIKTTDDYLHFATSIYASKHYNSHLDKVLSTG